MMIKQVACEGRRLVHLKGGKLEIFVAPTRVIKSVARGWRGPSWMAPLEPFGGYGQT